MPYQLPRRLLKNLALKAKEQTVRINIEFAISIIQKHLENRIIFSASLTSSFDRMYFKVCIFLSIIKSLFFNKKFKCPPNSSSQK